MTLPAAPVATASRSSFMPVPAARALEFGAEQAYPTRAACTRALCVRAAYRRLATFRCRFAFLIAGARWLCLALRSALRASTSLRWDRAFAELARARPVWALA